MATPTFLGKSCNLPWSASACERGYVLNCSFWLGPASQASNWSAVKVTACWPALVKHPYRTKKCPSPIDVFIKFIINLTANALYHIILNSIGTRSASNLSSFSSLSLLGRNQWFRRLLHFQIMHLAAMSNRPCLQFYQLILFKRLSWFPPRILQPWTLNTSQTFACQ